MQNDSPEVIFAEIIAAGKEQRRKQESELVAVISICSYPCFGAQCGLEHRPASK